MVRNLGDGSTLTQKTYPKESVCLWYESTHTVTEYEYYLLHLLISKCKYVINNENYVSSSVEGNEL